MHSDAPLIYVVCGESSGDQLAAAVLSALRQHIPHLRLRGVTGPALDALGATSVASFERLALTGLTEVITSLPALYALAAALEADLQATQPTLLLLVDAPGFNLRFVKRLRQLKLLKVQLVSPQIWAWRPERIDIIKKHVNHILLLFAFEQELYARVSVPHTWIGHPLVDRVLPTSPTLSPGPWQQRPPAIALLPGSRPQELARHLPALVEAAVRLHSRQPQHTFVLVVAPSLGRQRVKNALELLLQERMLPIQLDERPALQVLPEMRAAWIASGTATLEAALAGTPHVVIYKVSWVTWWLGRWLVRGTRWLGMGNILAHEELVPEVLQVLDPVRLVAALEPWLLDASTWQAQHDKLMKIRTLLGPPGAAERGALALKQLLTGASTTP